MPSIPLPFLVAVLLLILLAMIVRGDDERPANRPFIALIAACALQSTLIGLRWGYGIEVVRFLAPIVATTLPPLVYASFAALAQNRADRGPVWIWLHALPPILAAALMVIWRPVLDLAIIAVYLGYAAALLRIARRGPDGLGLAPLEGVVPAYRALQIAAVALAASAMVDLVVMLDFEWTRGAHAAAVIGIANLVGLLAFGLAAILAGRARLPAEAAEPVPSAARAEAEDEGRVIETVDDLLRSQELFRDANLNLNRLARKAGIPARRISVAINRLRAKNVSQYINEFRIAEACRLLAKTDEPVTQIMFEAGFQTKSNFNREFRRVTGMSPMAWRASKHRASPAP